MKLSSNVSETVFKAKVQEFVELMALKPSRSTLTQCSNDELEAFLAGVTSICALIENVEDVDTLIISTIGMKAYIAGLIESRSLKPLSE